MAERTIATVLKTVGFHDPGGSNPPPSAPKFCLTPCRSKARTCHPAAYLQHDLEIVRS